MIRLQLLALLGVVQVIKIYYGDMNKGKKRLEDTFGLQVVEMENTLKGTDYIYAHPEKRAEDLMQAFSDKSINGIFACIGGIDSIRLLPYIDFEIITRNPKIFIGYSDSTIIHYMCLKAGGFRVFMGLQYWWILLKM